VILFCYTILVIHRKIARHFLPSLDDDGRHRRAIALTVPALFLYLQILVVLTAGLYIIRLKAPSILGTASFSALQIINLTNKEREKSALSPLSLNQQLTQAANAKAADMFDSDYWAHNSPGGKTPWSFISAAGYKYVFAGENLARDFNDAGSVVNAWMDSPSHRSNLLDKNFKEIGVAVVNGKFSGRESTLVVQMFGSAVSQIPEKEPLAEVLDNQTASETNQESSRETLDNSSQFTVDSSPFDFAQGGQQETVSQQTAVLATRQFSIAKGISLFLVSFVFFLFALEILISLKKAHLRVRPGVIAHILLLGFVLFAVWYAVQGAII